MIPTGVSGIEITEAAVRSGHRDEALALVRELGPLARRPPSPWFDLQMLYARLHLAPDGRRRRQIDSRNGSTSSPRTVESHLYRVYPKFGVSSRAELISVIGSKLGTRPN